MKKYFIVADVHGFFDEMTKALDEVGFDKNNSDHIFVSLGDLTDRGPKALECLQFVNSLDNDRKILIKGNHEDLIEELLIKKRFQSYDYQNGTQKTIYQVIQEDPAESLLHTYEAIELFSENEDWNKYIKSCIDFYEDSNNIFVHGWIPVEFKYEGPWRDIAKAVYIEDWRESDWKNARWLNGMKCWDEGARIPGKTIFCGHWHTSWGHAYLHHDGVEWLNDVETGWIDPETGRQEPHMNSNPFEDEGICALDACTAYSSKINCKVINVPTSM